MPIIKCNMPDCVFETPNLDNAVAAVILSHYLSSAHPAPAQPKASTIPAPKISAGIYEDQYDCFKRNRDSYKENVHISADKIGVHLLSTEKKESLNISVHVYRWLNGHEAGEWRSGSQH